MISYYNYELANLVKLSEMKALQSLTECVRGLHGHDGL